MAAPIPIKNDDAAPPPQYQPLTAHLNTELVWASLEAAGLLLRWPQFKGGRVKQHFGLKKNSKVALSRVSAVRTGPVLHATPTDNTFLNGRLRHSSRPRPRHRHHAKPRPRPRHATTTPPPPRQATTTTTGPLFDQLSRLRSKCSRERSTPTPTLPATARCAVP